ncbi:Wzz/FepE/Etk N-terminal domain-containing protein [Enterovibrio sp. ZSDZ42]|uniref:Wzz/FepE/Etk N-terminal domain-containing protein n=1 Tax=Enterovibrio gelatinilyticus TaxID=2899819 RepID=A0ABT5R6Y8_9GAMM|nr:Wzz/FepE/Etk N-terminal domain-containing protein [Enterovibrio sp. ZSDZ42]MDD1796042.1 Wzz/FepE/Etk N-terminal domain-containing protein [Enterovibrio sp. ZSDZ42]
MENNQLSAKYPTDAQFQPPVAASDEIDLRELFSAIWKGKWIIIATTFLFAVAGVLYAKSLPNIYKADALLAPAETSGGGLSKMAAQFGGLASLAGVSLGGGEASQTDLAAEVMKSRQFVNAFIEKHELMVPLMAAKGWDLGNNQLILNEEIYNTETQTWLRKPQGLRGAMPSQQEMYDVFVKNTLSIGSDKTSGFYTLSIKHYSPYVAKQWTDWLIEDINKVMRGRTIKETTQNLVYLESQLQKTAIADMQSTFYSLIEEQTKSLMLAEVQDEFVFKVIDRPVVPEMKAEPKRASICVLATLLGGMLGMGIVLIQHAFKRED